MSRAGVVGNLLEVAKSKDAVVKHRHGTKGPQSHLQSLRELLRLGSGRVFPKEGAHEIMRAVTAQENAYCPNSSKCWKQVICLPMVNLPSCEPPDTSKRPEEMAKGGRKLELVCGSMLPGCL